MKFVKEYGGMVEAAISYTKSPCTARTTSSSWP